VGVVVREKKLGSNIWWVFATHQGRRRSKLVGDRKAAEAVASQLRARLVLGDQSVLDDRPPGPTSGLTFATVAERWLEWFPSLNAWRQGTLETHQSFLRTHLMPDFGSIPITEITRRRIQEFIAARRGAGGSRRTGKALTDTTLRVRLPTLKLILDYAVEERLIPSRRICP